MKIDINKEDLLQCLYLVQGVVEKRSSLPLLSHVLIECDSNEGEDLICLRATDLEIGIKQTCKGIVHEGGATTADARKLYEITRELPTGKVVISATGNGWVHVQSGNSRFRIASLEPKEFPTLAAVDNQGTEKQEQSSNIQIEGQTLHQMVAKTLFAASPDETRLNLSGVYLETDDSGKLRMVASDGHRLALIEKNVGTGSSNWPSVILPKKGLLETRKLLEKSNEKVEIYLDNSVLNVKKDTTQLFMRLVEGDFPDYKQVVPAEHIHEVQFSRDELLRCLRRILILTTERSRGVKLKFEEGKIEVSVNTPELGEGTEDIPAKYEGAGLSIGFNGRYMIEALNVMGDGEEATLFLKDDASPGLLQKKDSVEFSYVIMPMKIN